MSCKPILRVLPLALAAACGVKSDLADAAKPPPTCDVIKASTCPQTFAVITDPSATSPTTISVDDPVLLYHDCTPRPSGMVCEAWPQEYETVGYLTYEWTIRVGFQTFHYAPTTNPVRTVNCWGQQGVTATVKITNGSFSATASKSYGCGNEIQ